MKSGEKENCKTTKNWRPSSEAPISQRLCNYKIITKDDRQELTALIASGSGADEGMNLKDDDQDDEQAHDDEDADKHDVNKTTQDEEDDDDHDNDEKVEDDDEEQTESDDDGDDFVHPKLTTHDDDIIHEEETDEDDFFRFYQISNPLCYITLVQATQEIETLIVTLNSGNLDGQQQSSSVSSGFSLNLAESIQRYGVVDLFLVNILKPPISFDTLSRKRVIGNLSESGREGEELLCWGVVGAVRFLGVSSGVWGAEDEEKAEMETSKLPLSLKALPHQEYEKVSDVQEKKRSNIFMTGFTHIHGTTLALLIMHGIRSLQKSSPEKLDWINLKVANILMNLRNHYSLVPNLQGQKAKTFYAFAISRESARDVYSKKTVLLLSLRNKWTNLNVKNVIAFNVSFKNVYKKRCSIKRRVEDLQLGVKAIRRNSLNKADSRQIDAALHELHKFSGGTLDVRSDCSNDRLKGIRMEYLATDFLEPNVQSKTAKSYDLGD
ncbi:hypothetical protein Tco_0348695 [Tanacetum coccineum]